MPSFRILAATLALALLMSPVFAETPKPKPADASAKTITVFAAASMKDALDAVAGAFQTKTGLAVSVSYAGSMTLAKQIESGAPADLFIAADEASMDYLASRNLLAAGGRANLLGNSLVLVAPRSSKTDTVPLTKEGLDAALGSGRIATGDVASVPVGRYAKASFESLHLWGAFQSRFAFTDNVRSALLFVARDEAPLGVVYLTDAKSEPKVKIVATFPASSHPPIVYPVALPKSAQGDAPQMLLTFLKSAQARAIFAEKGFTPPDKM